MRPLSYFRMAPNTEINRFLEEERRKIRGMRLMAGHAHATCNRGMYFLPTEPLLIMTGITEVRRLCSEQFGVLRSVRVVTARAHANARRRMDCLAGKFCLVMTAVAEFRQF